MSKQRAGQHAQEISKRAGHLVRRLQQISVALFMEETKGFDVTTVQYATLRAVHAVPGIDSTHLIDIVAIDRTTIGRVIDRLEAKGLIRRASAAADKRVKQLYTTPAGEKLLARITTAVDRSQERLLAALPASKRQQFMAMLAELVHLNNEFSRVPVRPPVEPDGERRPKLASSR